MHLVRWVICLLSLHALVLLWIANKSDFINLSSDFPVCLSVLPRAISVFHLCCCSMACSRTKGVISGISRCNYKRRIEESVWIIQMHAVVQSPHRNMTAAFECAVAQVMTETPLPIAVKNIGGNTEIDMQPKRRWRKKQALSKIHGISLSRYCRTWAGVFLWFRGNDLCPSIAPVWATHLAASAKCVNKVCSRS